MPKTAGFELGSGENNDRARYVMIHILSPTIIMARKGKNNQNNAAAAAGAPRRNLDEVLCFKVRVLVVLGLYLSVGSS